MTIGYTATARWGARPAVSVATRYGLALVSVATALGRAQMFLFFEVPQRILRTEHPMATSDFEAALERNGQSAGEHVDSAPARGTRIDAWVPALMLGDARHEVDQRSETV